MVKSRREMTSGAPSDETKIPQEEEEAVKAESRARCNKFEYHFASCVMLAGGGMFISMTQLSD